MALNFNGTTHQVVHNGTILDGVSPLTIWLRVRLSDLATRDNYFCLHQADPPFDRGLFFPSGFAELRRSYSGTAMIVTASANAIPINTWQDWFIVDAGASVNPRLYFGSLDADLAEVASYSGQQQPTGTVSSNNADWKFGQRDTTRRMTGDLSRVAMFSAALDLKQCRQVRRKPFIRTDLILFSEYGYGHGTGAQLDWSGNGNDGTVTAATLANHAPAPPLTPARAANFPFLQIAVDMNKRRSAFTPLPVLTLMPVPDGVID